MQQKDVSLIVGADGLIGKALADDLVQTGEGVLTTTRKADTLSKKRSFLDLLEDVSAWSPPKQVSVAYLCAAITSLETCRRNPKQSERVNVGNTVALAKTLIAEGTFVVFLSTNLVYDGSVPFRKADEPVSFRVEYGRQKAETEKRLLALGPSVSVVRLTKVLGPNMPLFNKWIQVLQKGEVIHPFSDMVMAPVPLLSVVDILYQVAQKRLPGILQVSGKQDITYQQAACYIAQRLRVSQELPKQMKEIDVDTVFSINSSIHCNYYCVADAYNAMFLEYLAADKVHMASV